MTHTELDSLCVVHQPKDAAGHGMRAADVHSLQPQGLFIDTCLRQLCIVGKPITGYSHYDVLTGSHAYAFLLQTVTGLNSSIPGETNIQGQFRCAWKRWQKTAPARQIWFLNQLMPALLKDAGQVRREHLQNLGGASYGSLTRKLLQPETNARVLFTGAGKFARTMLPMFTNWETGLWNHRLHKGLQTDARLFAPEDRNDAARWATHLVMTIPPEDDCDRPWMQLAEQHRISHVIHLGRRRAEPGCWSQLDTTCQYHDLDDLFDLRKSQATLRNFQTLKARRACERIARHKGSPVLAGQELLPLGI